MTTLHFGAVQNIVGLVDKIHKQNGKISATLARFENARPLVTKTICIYALLSKLMLFELYFNSFQFTRFIFTKKSFLIGIIYGNWKDI